MHRTALIRCLKQRLFIRTFSTSLLTVRVTAQDATKVVAIRIMTVTASSNSNRRSLSSEPNLRLSNTAVRTTNSKSSSLAVLSNDKYRSFNHQITKCETAKELLQLLNDQKDGLTEKAGGKAFDAVNLSTSLHRLGRFSARSANDRARILADPRFALLLASVGEVLDHKSRRLRHSTHATMLSFSTREFSNIAWAIAKLRIALPYADVPSLSKVSNRSSTNESTTIAITCQEIRSKVSEYETLCHHDPSNQQYSTKSQSHQQPWIPITSRLAGYILDEIAVRVFNRSTNDAFNVQTSAILLWSWATSSRVDTHAFHAVIHRMILFEVQRLEMQDDDVPALSKLPPSMHRRSANKYTLQPQGWSNALWAAATAHVYSPRLLNHVAHLFQTKPNFIDDFNPQDLANTAWAVATMLLKNAATTNNCHSDSSSGSENDETSSSTKDAKISALEIIGSILRVVPMRAAAFNEQELANTLWATATLGFGVRDFSQDSSLNNYVVLPTNNLELDQHLMQQSVTAILEAALPKMYSFRPQELVNIAWALARLIPPDTTMNQDPLIQRALLSIAEQLCDRNRFLTTQNIGISLWSLATIGFESDDVHRKIASRMNQEHVKRATPQELSKTIWALASADVKTDDKDGFDTTLLPDIMRQPIEDPVTVLYGSVAQELMQRPHEFTSQNLSNIVWSFSKQGIRHPSLFRCVAVHLVGDGEDNNQGFNDGTTSRPPRGFSEFSPQNLSNVAWAFAKQAQLGTELPARLPTNGNVFKHNRGKFTAYETSCRDYGEYLVQRLFQGIANAGLDDHERLRRFNPQALANSAWAFSALGMCHSPFMDAVVLESQRRLERFVQGEVHALTPFTGQAIANLLWSIASVNVVVPAHDLVRVIDSFANIMCQDENGTITPMSVARVLNRQALANIAWSCAVIGEYPPHLMELIYIGLFGQKGTTHNDPRQLCRVHNDSGLHRQQIWSLMYVQAAMDLEGKNSIGLHLPAHFPQGWYLPQDLDQDGASHIDLNLSISKTQLDVSKALFRIGFDHVQEFVLTMEDLLNQGGGVHSVTPPSVAIMDLMSIDIANKDCRIAIEVDGPSHYVCAIDNVLETNAHANVVRGGNREDLLFFQWTGEKQRINGTTHLKERLLTLLGWKVMHIPFWEWSAFYGDLEAQNSYCRQLLEAA